MKTKQILQLVVGVGANVLLLQGCAHSQTDHKIDQSLAQGAVVSSPSELNKENVSAIQESTTLTDDQKQKLLALNHSIRVQSDDLRLQSLKLRALLVQTLIKQDYSVDEVRGIKKRLEKVEKQRLKVIFSAIDQANMILGRANKNADTERVMATIYDNNL
jgi:hypothetical protein